MSAASQEFGQLLNYLAEHRVVVCRECQYAIQPYALSSHLKKHKIFRGSRQELLRQLAQCDLAAPELVLDPSPNAPPVPGIPVYQGHRCLSPGCTYLCTAEKRLSQHWSQTHGLSGKNHVEARPAKLQTFFRGTRLRYFEVHSSAEVTEAVQPTEDDSDKADEPAMDASSEGAANTPQLESPGFMDVDAIMYMHHYTVSTAQTLTLGIGCPKYLSDCLPQEAAKRKYLLYAILGIAACHKACLTTDQNEHDRHKFASLRYQSEGVAAYRKAIDNANEEDAVALAATARFLGIQDGVLSGIDGENDFWNAQTADDAAQVLTRFLVLLQGCGNTLLRFHQHFPRVCGMRLPPSSLRDIQTLANSNGVNSAGQPTIYDQTRDWSAVPVPIVASLRSLPGRLHGVAAITPADMSLLVRCCGVLLEAVSLAFGQDGPCEWNVWAGSIGFVVSRAVHESLLPALQQRSTAAFVVLAMYGKCLTCCISDSTWFTVGQIDRYLHWCKAGLAGHDLDELTRGLCEVTAVDKMCRQ